MCMVNIAGRLPGSKWAKNLPKIADRQVCCNGGCPRYKQQCGVCASSPCRPAAGKQTDRRTGEGSPQAGIANALWPCGGILQLIHALKHSTLTLYSIIIVGAQYGMKTYLMHALTKPITKPHNLE